MNHVLHCDLPKGTTVQRNKRSACFKNSPFHNTQTSAHIKKKKKPRKTVFTISYSLEVNISKSFSNFYQRQILTVGINTAGKAKMKK